MNLSARYIGKTIGTLYVIYPEGEVPVPILYAGDGKGWAACLERAGVTA